MVIEQSDYWRDLMRKQIKAAPLNFVAGFCHSVGKGFHCPLHFHPFLEIVYHPSGQGITQTSGGQKIPFHEGAVIIYPPGEPHDQLMKSTGEDWCLQMTAPKQKGTAPTVHLPTVASTTIVEDIRILSHGYTRMEPAQHSVLNFRATAALISLLQLAFANQADLKMSQAERYVAEAERLIGEKFNTLDSLQQIADEVGISSDHLRHIFKTQRGISLIRYLNEVRIKRAKVLLAHSRMPLKEIATICGFKDEYYFSTVFRKLAGNSPGQYRLGNETRISS